MKEWRNSVRQLFYLRHHFCFFLGKWKKPKLYALMLARCLLDHRDPDIINYEILTCNYFFGKLINIFLE